MLLEKYKPRHISEFVGNKKQLLEMLEWARSQLSKSSLSKGKPLLLVGPHGSGKSLAVELVARELNLQVCEFTGDIKRFIVESGQQSIFSKGKLIVVDESDLATIRNIPDLIKKTTHPVIFISVNPYQRFGSLRRQCRLVRFFKIRIDSMIKFLCDICEKEKIKYDKSALSQLAKMCNGDLRAALIDLELLGNEITMERVNKLGFRLQEDSIFETLKIIFKTKNIENTALAINKSEKSIDEILSWLAENVPYEYDDPEDVANAYRYLSLADTFSSRIAKRQAWVLEKHFHIGAYGTALSKKMPYRKFFVYKFPAFRKNETEKVLEKISSRLGISKKKSKYYLKLLNLLAKHNKDIAKEFNFNENDMEILKRF